MTTAADAMEAVYNALRVDDPNGLIARPGDLPAQIGQYPRRRLRYVAEVKQSQGRASIGFTTIVTIRVVCEVSEPASLDDDVSITTIDARLQAMKQRTERAIINSSPLFGIVQQLVSVQTQLAYDAQATHLAGLQSDYAFEIYESGEDFAPLETEPLTEIVATDPHHPGPAFGVQYQ